MDSDGNKLFVGGISRETNEDVLKQYFSKYGVVLDAVVVRDKITGTSRCFGFVRLSDASSVDEALRDSHVILGRPVDVNKALPKFTQLQIQQRQHQHYGESQQNNGVHRQGSNGNQRTKKIFVGGLSSSITDEEFKHYFERFGRITDVVVMRDSGTNRPRGFGFVTFDSEDSVENVLQNNFHDLNDKRVEVKPAIPKEGILNSNSNYDSRFGVGGGSTNNRSESGFYSLDAARFGSYVHYVPIYGFNFGFPYQVDAYGNGHHSLFPYPMMPKTEIYFPPAYGYLASANSGFAFPGVNHIGHNTSVGPQLNPVIDNVNKDVISSKFEGLKLESGNPVPNGTTDGASREPDQGVDAAT